MQSFMSGFRSTVELLWIKDLHTLHLISNVFILNGILCLVTLLTGITAPYGRYARSGWGVGINPRIAWFVQELPALMIPVLFLLFDQYAPMYNRTANMIFLLLFIIHYIHRALVFPLFINSKRTFPLSIFLIAFHLCLINGYLQSAYLLHHADYGLNWASKCHIWIGLVMFLAGLVINIHSDHVLRNTRKPGETGYKIPQGGMFNYVSGANFFGEILEWMGFAVACWTFPSFAFAFSTVFTIGTRGWQHHQFYLQKFENYPKDRKALIPFIL